MVICHITPLLRVPCESRQFFCLGRSPGGLTGQRTEAELLKLVQALTPQASVALLALKQALQEP
jgi:hypothetical protein